MPGLIVPALRLVLSGPHGRGTAARALSVLTPGAQLVHRFPRQDPRSEPDQGVDAYVLDLEGSRVLVGDRIVPVVLGSPRAGEVGIVEDLLVDRAFTNGPDSDVQDVDGLGTDGSDADVPGEATELASLGDLTVDSVDELRWLLGAAALARATGLSARAIRAGLRSGPPAPHRHLGVIDGVAWVDGTGSAVGPQAYDVVVWVLAPPEAQALAAQVSAATPHLRAVLGPRSEDNWSNTELIRQARDRAQPGDTVLLSGAGLVEVVLAGW